MMLYLVFIPFILQALAIGCDEAFFHVKRGLPKWERIGHPIDTSTVLACFLIVLFVPYSAYALKWYIGMGILSCIMITKDEFVHKHHCPPFEHWLHALLFINHPIMLTALGFMWPVISKAPLPFWFPLNWSHEVYLYPFILLQTGFIFLFFLYQIIYWNFIWKGKVKTS